MQKLILQYSHLTKYASIQLRYLALVFEPVWPSQFVFHCNNTFKILTMLIQIYFIYLLFVYVRVYGINNFKYAPVNTTITNNLTEFISNRQMTRVQTTAGAFYLCTCQVTLLFIDVLYCLNKWIYFLFYVKKI